jgi:two-component system response regulator FixJ
MPGERTVHVVDDDAAVRRSLERLLDAAGFRVVTYQSASDFLAVAAALSGCVLLDIRMPKIDGFEVQSRLLELNADLPVIVMTGQADVPSAVRAMKAGAVDFIEKPCDDDVLVETIEVALTRPTQGEQERERAQAARRIARLSPREREVLDALVNGQPNKVIAYDLGLSVRTVEVHRARMMERLGVRQLAEAVRLAILSRLSS